VSAYLDNFQYEDALQLYIKILEDTPKEDEIQRKIISTINHSDQILSKFFLEIREILPTVFTWAGGLFCLYIITRAIRFSWSVYYKIRLRKNKTFLLMPFSNSTGSDEFAGLEQAVRYKIAEWLHTQSEGSLAKDEMINVWEKESHEVSSSGFQLITTLIGSIRPALPAFLVEGMIIGKTENSINTGHETQIGIGLQRSKIGDSRVGNVKIHWRTVASNASLSKIVGEYLTLANGVATWIYDPSIAISAEAASTLTESAEAAKLGHEHANRGEKEEAHFYYELATSLANEAYKTEIGYAEPVQGELTEAELKAIEEIQPYNLAKQRAELYEKYRDEL